MDNPLERRSFDIGWLVGIIDGEGCFTLASKNHGNNGKLYYPVIQITNTNIKIIERAKRIYSDLGLTCYFYARLPKKGRPYYRLEVSGLKRVKRFMDVLGDLLECRKEQAGLLRQYVEVRLSKTSHSPLSDDEHAIAQALSDLNNNRTPASSTTGCPALERDEVTV